MGCDHAKPLQLSMSKRPEVQEVHSPRSQIRLINFKALQVQSISSLFDLTKTCGSTETGTLFEGIDKKSKCVRLIREVSTLPSFSSNLLFQEVSILSQLYHPNILKVFQVIETPRRHYIILELIEGGSLKSNITRTCDEETVSKYMLDIFRAINYMHLQGIVHCDINADNILLSNNSFQKTPKLSGFCCSQKLGQLQDFEIKSISYHYASPEMLGGDYGTKTDMWSAGVLLYNLLVGKLPFHTKEKTKIIEEIYTGNLDFTHPNFCALSNNAQDLIRNLLVVDPLKRYSAHDALNHKWLQQCRKDIYLTYETVNRLRFFKVIDR